EAVRYIRTFAMSFFFHGQPGLTPCTQTARKAHGLAEALAFQRGRRLAGAIAVVAVDDHRLVLVLSGNFRADGFDTGERHVLRAENMPGSVLARIAHVDDERILAVDELRGLRGADGRAAAEATHVRPQQHRARHHRDRGEQAITVLLQEFQQGRFHERIIIIERCRVPRTSSSCCATASRNGTGRTASPAGSTWTSRPRVSKRRATPDASSGPRVTASISPTPRCSSAPSARCGSRSTSSTRCGFARRSTGA